MIKSAKNIGRSVLGALSQRRTLHYGTPCSNTLGSTLAEAGAQIRRSLLADLHCIQHDNFHSHAVHYHKHRVYTHGFARASTECIFRPCSNVRSKHNHTPREQATNASPPVSMYALEQAMAVLCFFTRPTPAAAHGSVLPVVFCFSQKSAIDSILFLNLLCYGSVRGSVRRTGSRSMLATGSPNLLRFCRAFPVKRKIPWCSYICTM